MEAATLWCAEETPFVYKIIRNILWFPDEFSKMWALLVLKSSEITLYGSNWDRKTAGRKLLWNLHCRDVLNVSATERLQQKALNTIKKRHRETSMKITMSWYFKPQVTSSCTETCRLLKIIELLMFNYRRADQLDKE